LTVSAAFRMFRQRSPVSVADGDVARHSVVRVADEVVIALMATTAGVDYEEASRDAVTMVVQNFTSSATVKRFSTF
jgi:hypothetical protein